MQKHTSNYTFGKVPKTEEKAFVDILKTSRLANAKTDESIDCEVIMATNGLATHSINNKD